MKASRKNLNINCYKGAKFLAPQFRLDLRIDLSLAKLESFLLKSGRETQKQNLTTTPPLSPFQIRPAE